MKFDYSPVAYTGQFWIQENRSPACTHCALDWSVASKAQIRSSCSHPTWTPSTHHQKPAGAELDSILYPHLVSTWKHQHLPCQAPRVASSGVSRGGRSVGGLWINSGGQIIPPPKLYELDGFVYLWDRCFLGQLVWGGDSQTVPKPPQITQKITFFTRISPFVFPNLTKNPGVGGWVGGFKDLGKFSPPKNDLFYFWGTPLMMSFKFVLLQWKWDWVLKNSTKNLFLKQFYRLTVSSWWPQWGHMAELRSRVKI